MENTGELTTHLTTGAVVVYAIEWAKKAHWIPLTVDTRWLNRGVSLVLAVVTAVGITWHYDAVAGDLVVHGLTWTAVSLTVWESIKQFVLQQVVYDTVVPTPKETP